MQNNIHKNHRERMKQTYLQHGLDAFSDVEKLEFILFYAIARKDTNPIAHNLINEFGSLDKVLEAPISELEKVDGMGTHSAILLHLLLQSNFAYGQAKTEKYIYGTETAKAFAKHLLKGKFVEEFYVICLASNNKVIGCKLINRGTKSQVPVEIRNITDFSLKNNCERIIVIHNHPDGEARPSDDDIAFTSKILISCIINNIEVIDHIIVAQDKAFSFEETHILPELKEDVINKIPGIIKNSTKFSDMSSNYIIGK